MSGTFKSPANPPRALRPVDLARAAGISAQQVRNYEEAGILPPATRSPSGYRRYEARHRQALLAYRALMRAYGVERARGVMRSVHAGDVPGALEAIDAGHAELHEQRGNLRAAGEALEAVASRSLDGAGDDVASGLGAGSGPGAGGGLGMGTGLGAGGGHGRGAVARVALPIGDVAGRIGVRTSALRVWEAAGLLTPGRDPATGYRAYGPSDLRDARMVDMLRRLHYPLPQIAPVLDGLRREGSSEALRDAIARRQADLDTRAAAMLEAAALLHTYLTPPPNWGKDFRG